MLDSFDAHFAAHFAAQSDISGRVSGKIVFKMKFLVDNHMCYVKVMLNTTENCLPAKKERKTVFSTIAPKC